jgi:hypothetical protein
VVSGGFFLHDNTSEFLKSTVQTTLDSMVPLTQVMLIKGKVSKVLDFHPRLHGASHSGHAN